MPTKLTAWSLIRQVDTLINLAVYSSDGLKYFIQRRFVSICDGLEKMLTFASDPSQTGQTGSVF